MICSFTLEAPPVRNVVPLCRGGRGLAWQLSGWVEKCSVWTLLCGEHWYSAWVSASRLARLRNRVLRPPLPKATTYLRSASAKVDEPVPGLTMWVLAVISMAKERTSLAISLSISARVAAFIVPSSPLAIHFTAGHLCCFHRRLFLLWLF